MPSCKHRILIAMQGLFSVSNDGSVDCHAGKHIFQSPLPCHLLFHVPRIIVSIVEKMSQFVHRRAVWGWGVNPPEHDSVVVHHHPVSPVREVGQLDLDPVGLSNRTNMPSQLSHGGPVRHLRRQLAGPLPPECPPTKRSPSRSQCCHGASRSWNSCFPSPPRSWLLLGISGIASQCTHPRQMDARGTHRTTTATRP